MANSVKTWNVVDHTVGAIGGFIGSVAVYGLLCRSGVHIEDERLVDLRCVFELEIQPAIEQGDPGVSVA